MSIMQKNKTWCSTEKCLDSLSLIAVMQYVAYRFLQSTMFAFIYTDAYKTFTFGLLLLTGGLRFLLLQFRNIFSEEGSGRIRACLKILVTGCLAVPFAFVGWKHDYKFLIFLPLVVISLYGIDAHKVLKWFTWTVGILLAATVICSLTGAVKNLAYFKHSRMEAAYGIINTTDFASYITYLFLFIWCYQKNRGRSFWFIASAGLIGFLNYWITDSSTALFSGILTVVVILWNSLEKTDFSRRHARFGKTVDRLIPFLVLVICFVLVAFIILYGKGNPTAVYLDELLNGRLKVSWNAYEKYGVHLFGSTIQSMHGNGGTMIPFNWHINGYGYIDIAYAMLLIRYGWIVFFIVIGFWAWMIHKCIQREERKIALAMVVIAFHAVAEARFLDINYNVFLGMPFCAWGLTQREKEKELVSEECNKQTNKYHKVILAIFMAVILYFTMPKILSWLRTIYSLNGWTVGIYAWGALVVSVCLVLLVVALYRQAYQIWQLHNRKAWILFSMVLVFMICGVFAGNVIIYKGATDNENRMKTEEQAVRLIQSSANGPVFVADLSELYQRQFGGFSEHAFSTEELYRVTNGTVLTNCDTDATGIMMVEGSQYVQISPWSGVYTFDAAVIKTLADAGYDCKPFYYSEKKSNLSDLAIRNGLSVDNAGKVIVKGPERSILTNLEMDQFSGCYEVKISIEMVSANNKGRICDIKVLGEAGDRSILERSVTYDEFDENGKCIIFLSYEIRSTPKVSYLLVAEDNVELLVDEIAWHRVK